MSVLSDRQIRDRNFINPMQPGERIPGVLSYGVSSYGYDATLGNEFLVMKGVGSGTYNQIIDPKNFNQELLEKVHREDGEQVIIPPHGFLLATTKEVFEIPRDVIAICLGKSTYARCGIIVNVTPLEPEWVGQVTMEISNTTPHYCVVYAGEGICQFLFLRGDSICQVSYADKKGKYQNQVGIQTAKVINPDLEKEFKALKKEREELYQKLENQYEKFPKFPEIDAKLAKELEK